VLENVNFLNRNLYLEYIILRVYKKFHKITVTRLVTFSQIKSQIMQGQNFQNQD